MSEKTIFWSIKIEFFTRAEVEFLLNLHNPSVAEVVEIRLFGYVFSDKLVCVLNCAFLPGAVRIGEIDDDPVTPP